VAVPCRRSGRSADAGDREAVERALGPPGGGLIHYEGDVYPGGNPWVLGMLWLGVYRRQCGDASGHARPLAYARDVATPLGLLPEHVTDDGAPAWVVPLAWSHAMLVLAPRPELETVRGPSTPSVGASVPTEKAVDETLHSRDTWV
jgi:hypothetical protein